MAKQPESGMAGSTAGLSRASHDLGAHNRAANAARIGLGAQVVLSIAAFFLYEQGSPSGVVVPLNSVFWFASAGLIPWIAILIAVSFRRAKTVEDLELEAARRTGEADRTIFASEADARPAGRRLARVYKFVLPAAAVVLGLVLIYHGFWRFRATVSLVDLSYKLGRPQLLAGVFAGCAFAGFIIGRYLLGMSANAAWSLLRGGATYLIGTVYVFALMALSAGAAGLGTDEVNGVVRYIVPLFLLLVGIEVLLNVVLDLYRPKAADETPRPAFDSRLLSLLASPGDVVKSLNEAINYQFGFEITRSWFWRLLSRSFGWLVLFGAFVLVLLSSVVIVEPHEMALVTRFGRLDEQPLPPGVWLKAPWPLSMVDKYEVTRVEEMVVGSHDAMHEQSAILWTTEHAHPQSLMIVAPSRIRTDLVDPEVLDAALIQGADAGAPPAGDAAGRRVQIGGGDTGAANRAQVTTMSAPSVGLAAADVFVQWKIDPSRLHQFATNAADPALRLRQIANAATARELLKYDIDSAIGSARSEISAAIRQRIEQKIEQERLGIELLWVGVSGVHPPQNVAEAFNAGAAMVQSGEEAVQQGRVEQIRLLTTAAGSVGEAQRIVGEYERLQALRRQQEAGEATLEQVQAQQAELERLVQRAGGDAAVRLLEARRQRWLDENEALAESSLRPNEFAAYQQAPRYWRSRRYLEVLATAMRDKKKIVLMTEDVNPQIDLDLKETIDALTNVNIPQRTGGTSPPQD